MPEIEIDLPVVGGDRNTWGTKANAAILAAVQAVNGSVSDIEVRNVAGTDRLFAIHVDDSETDLGPLPVGPGGSDAGVAGYIETPESATRTALTAQTVAVRTSDGYTLPPDVWVVLTLDKTLAQITADPTADIADITFEEQS